MLPVYDISISYDGIKKMSKNVADILDVVFDLSENLSLSWAYSYLFPRYLVEEDFEQCKKWLRELREMAKDDFSRDCLKPIYEYILFQLLNDRIHYLREVVRRLIFRTINWRMVKKYQKNITSIVLIVT